MFTEVFIPVTIMGGLGLVFGLGLAVASKKFAVPVDDKVARVREALPGVNCGACGQTGCDAFAEGVASGTCPVNGCPVGGDDVARRLAEIMGVEAVGVEKKLARVMCAGSYDVTTKKFDYSGIEDCAAAASLYAGPWACSYGCVGMGNCVKACPFGAITIDNGVAKITASKCTGCGRCLASCPKGIIELVPPRLEYTVRCSSRERGTIVRQQCQVGCIGCGRCAKTCPVGAIELKGTLARIIPELCRNCGKCCGVCPTKAINTFLCDTVV